MTAEGELARLLVGTARWRQRHDERIAALARAADFDALARLLDEQRLLPLAAHRLEQSAPGAMPAAFRERAEAQARHWRHLAALRETVAVSLAGELEAGGIAAVPLKGPLLARELYGDPGLRFSWDVDLLVDRSRLDEAAALLAGHGYGDSMDLPWENGRPLLHHALPPRQPGLPPVDLHWRVHWYETELSRAMLERSTVDAGRGRRLQPADELAALLLFFARDSFLGLRLVADIAGWWDLHQHRLGAAPLDPVLEARPELRNALVAAATVSGALAGVPVERLMGPRWRLDRRAALAVRLANWEMSGSDTDRAVNQTAVDWLLAPRRQWRSVARRYMFQPSEAIARSYGRQPGRGFRNGLWRLGHGSARTAKFGFRYARLWWRLRGGRSWSAG